MTGKGRIVLLPVASESAGGAAHSCSVLDGGVGEGGRETSQLPASNTLLMNNMEHQCDEVVKLRR